MSNGNSALAISWSKLEEIDTNGDTTSNRVNSFSNLAGGWSNPTVVTRNGFQCTDVTLTTTFEVGAKGKKVSGTSVPFTLSACVYSTDATVTHGDYTYDVKKNHVKFTVTVEDWPFLNPANTLRFGASLETTTEVDEYMAEYLSEYIGDFSEYMVVGEPTDGEYNASIGAAEMDIATTCIVDNETADVESTVTGGNSEAEITWDFPSFSTRLEYDPTIGFKSIFEQDSDEDSDNFNDDGGYQGNDEQQGQQDFIDNESVVTASGSSVVLSSVTLFVSAVLAIHLFQSIIVECDFARLKLRLV